MITTHTTRTRIGNVIWFAVEVVKAGVGLVFSMPLCSTSKHLLPEHK